MTSLFFSYSHKDKSSRDELEAHLAMLRNRGLVDVWHDGCIAAGDDFDKVIFKNLETANIILLLVSSDFLNSAYCFKREMSRAMERHEAGEARVIPVILRDCLWRAAPFGKLQAVPRDGRPIKSWPDRDEALTDVARQIEEALEALEARRSPAKTAKTEYSPRKKGTEHRDSDPADLLETLLKTLPSTTSDRIRRKVEEMIHYSPKVVLIGKAGVGKSSVCNKLFGKDAFKVSAVEEGTTEPQKETVKLGSGGFQLVDLPGLGLTIERDQTYSNLYAKWLKDVDVILWVLKADDRALAVEQAFFRESIEPVLGDGKAVVFAINQVDKMDPIDDWVRNSNVPGPSQFKNIKMRKTLVARTFSLSDGHSRSRIVAVSANNNYGISELIAAIVDAAPAVAKASMLRQFKPENIKPETVRATRQAVEKEIGAALPIATGVGAAAGAGKGAYIGMALGGPVGALIGAAAGAVVGGLGLRKLWKLLD